MTASMDTSANQLVELDINVQNPGRRRYDTISDEKRELIIKLMNEGEKSSSEKWLRI